MGVAVRQGQHLYARNQSGTESEKPNIKGFVIAGADRRWYPAKARRNEKERYIEVWSDLVPEPVAVRYGWASNPDGNLAHEWYDNLPVPTFRTG